MAVQSIEHPVSEDLVVGFYQDSFFAFRHRIIDAMVVIETYVASLEERVHLVVEDEIFGDAAFQSSFGQQPEFVARNQSLFDVVGRKENGFMPFDSQLVEERHDFDPTDYIQEGGRFVKHDQRTFLNQSFCDHDLLTFSIG